MIRKTIILLTLTAFVAAVSPVSAAEPVVNGGLISKRTKLNSEEKTSYNMLAAQSAPDLRRAGSGNDDRGHYIVLATFTALTIVAIVFALNKKKNTPPAFAPAPPPGD